MSDLCRLIWCALIGVFRPRAALQAENLVLRHQLNVLRRKSPKRLAFGNVDRLVFTALYHVAPGALDALKILKPQTVIRWNRAGFRTYWRWSGRPKTPTDIRQLIRDMSIANPLWGAPRIHGELLKLGIDVGQTTVAKYMARRRRPPSQGWKTFLRNHTDGIASSTLAGKVSCLHRQTGDIAAWPRQACDQTAADGIGCQRKNDGDDRRCHFQCRHGRYGGNDDVDREPDEFGCDFGIALGMPLRPAVFDRYGASLDPAKLP
jgi:hypothetical protein